MKTEWLGWLFSCFLYSFRSRMVGDDLDVVEPNISIRYVVESKAIGDVVFGKLAWGLEVE